MIAEDGPNARQIPIRALVPNVLTSVALCCGLAALHFAMKQKWEQAVLAVVFSAIFDMLDGRAARLLRVSSRFGAVLDSLSDFLSFGVAPAVILYLWKIGDKALLGRWEAVGIGAVMLFALCSALRLARFTSQIPATPPMAKTNPALANFFVGMPTPAAAGAVLIPVMLDNSRRLDAKFTFEIPWQVPVALAIFIAWLMISRVPMFSFKKVRVSRAWRGPLLALVAVAIALAVWDLWLAAAGGSFLYLATLPASVISYRRAVAADAKGALLTTRSAGTDADVLRMDAARKSASH